MVLLIMPNKLCIAYNCSIIVTLTSDTENKINEKKKIEAYLWINVRLKYPSNGAAFQRLEAHFFSYFLEAVKFKFVCG